MPLVAVGRTEMTWNEHGPTQEGQAAAFRERPPPANPARPVFGVNRRKAFLAGTWREERRWLVLRSLCALVWAVELFWVQKLAFEANPMVSHPGLVQLIRFYLDLVLTMMLSLLLQRRYLLPLLVFNLIALSVIGTYATYFHRPLMPVAAYHQWREGWSLHPDYPHIMSWQVASVVLATFGLKFGLLLKSGRFAVPGWVRWQTAVGAAVLYALPVIPLQFTRFNLRTDAFVTRNVFAYGYALPWIMDLAKNRKLAEHAARARAYLPVRYDRITPLEKPLSVTNHVLVLQLETISTQAVEATCQGVPMMPFLRALKDESMSFRIRAFHNNGSCDMDFAAATFTEPYPWLVPYRLPGLKYTNAMPAFMKRYGYRTYVFHGNSQQFYERGPLMEQLGFDHLFFREQLANRHLQASVKGIRDAELFRCILEAVQSERRAYIFAITLDTHPPFDFINQSEMDIFPHPANAVERYLNSIRHLDHCLQNLINGLPEGTTLVMYGDHTASLKTDLFVSDVVDGVEYVGCLIYQKGDALSQYQQTRNQPIATAGTLNLLDVLSYLRHSIEVSNDTMVNAAALAP